MPTRRLTLIALMLAIPFAIASPLPPWVSAARSTNGRFLVISEFEYDNPNPRVVRHLVGTTYRVLELEAFINQKDRLSTPLQLYSQGSSWEVKLPFAGPQFWPLISNDGQTLVLLGVNFAYPGAEALRVYRRKQYDGELIRKVHLVDLWTDAELNPGGNRIYGFSEASPQWFSGGTLAFSPDDRALLYETQWHDHLSIRLNDGDITREAPH